MKDKTDGTNIDCYEQEFSVSYNYPVYFTHDVFDPANPILRDAVLRNPDGTGPRRLLVYVDEGLLAATPKLCDSICAYADAFPSDLSLQKNPETVPGGERTKNGWNVVQNVMASIGGSHLCRHSYVIVLGGGSAIDMVGFAASLVHRGVRLIRIPTTVLGQNDAGVGVKNGMDEHGMKNFVGTFAPPSAVINDFEFLKTLEDKYWIGGLSEAFKVAIIKDAAFFNFLCENADKLRQRDQKAIEHVVRQAAILHLDHIRSNGDPFEMGTARPLDFGHWAAHRLEVTSNYRLGHGQAVAIGIAMDTYYAAQKNLVSEEEMERVLQAMRGCGLPIWDPLLHDRDENNVPTVIRGLNDFREHLGGQLTVTLPDGIGRKKEVHEMDTRIIMQGVDYLKQRFGTGE